MQFFTNKWWIRHKKNINVDGSVVLTDPNETYIL